MKLELLLGSVLGQLHDKYSKEKTLTTSSFTRRSLCAAAVSVATIVALPSLSWADDPIRIVVPYPPGGPLDVTARSIAEEARADLGNIIVENKPGAGGNIGVEYVSKQKPDGKIFVMGALATHAVNPNLFSKIPYDPIKDFTPLTLVAQTPNVLVITPEFSQKTGIKDLKGLIDYAKKNPDALNYASGGNGSAGHMSGELLKTSSGLKIMHIPFKGAAAAQMSVLSGQCDLIFDNLASSAANIKAGKLIPLAVTTQFRAPELPNVPTMAEAGVPGFDISTWYAFFGPANMDKSVQDKLNKALVKAIKSQAMAVRFEKMGAVAKPGTSADLDAFVKAELAKYKKIVEASGAKVD